MTSSNKGLIYGLAAVGALVGGAVLFHIITNKSTASSGSRLAEDIDALGTPQKDARGILTFPYFKDLMGVVSKHSKERFGQEKKELLAQRRELLKDHKMDEYKEKVQDMMRKEEQNLQDIMMEVVDHIGLTEQEFMYANQTYMSNPQTAQIIMQAQVAPSEDSAPKLTRQKTKEIFLFTEEQKMQKMKQMMSQGMKKAMLGGGGNAPSGMDNMMEIMIQQIQLTDEIFFKYGVDEEELNSSMLQHNLMHDPEIQRTMMMNMQVLQQMDPGMMGGY